jgi:hypothetical protein
MVTVGAVKKLALWWAVVVVSKAWPLDPPRALATCRTSKAESPRRLSRRSFGLDEFLPDFLIRKSVSRGSGQRPLHRLIPVEVKYRHDVGGFLHRYGGELFEKVAQAWPDLCFIFVTDNPAPGRSSFQVVDLWDGQTSVTRDLHMVTDLDIYESTAREYEGLVHEIFPLLDRRPSAAGRIASAT